MDVGMGETLLLRVQHRSSVYELLIFVPLLQYLPGAPGVIGEPLNKQLYYDHS